MNIISWLIKHWTITLFLAYVPQVLVIAAIVAFFHLGFLGFALIILGYNLFRLVAWGMNSASSWFVFKLVGREMMAKTMFEILKTANLPPPEIKYADPLYYFECVSNDENCDIKKRLVAANIVGGYECLSNSLDIQGTLQWRLSVADALDRLKLECSSPPRKVT